MHLKDKIAIVRNSVFLTSPQPCWLSQNHFYIVVMLILQLQSVVSSTMRGAQINFSQYLLCQGRNRPWLVKGIMIKDPLCNDLDGGKLL